MVQHGMRRKADFAGHAKPLRLGLEASLETYAVIGAERFHAVEPLQKIEMPHGAPEFAVGGTRESDGGLFSDDATMDASSTARKSPSDISPRA